MDPNTSPTPRTFASLGVGDYFSFRPVEHDPRAIKDGPTLYHWVTGSYGRSDQCEPGTPVYNVKTDAEVTAEREAQETERRRQLRVRASLFRRRCAAVAQELCKVASGKWELEPLPKPNPNNPPMHDPRESARGVLVFGVHRIALTLGLYRNVGPRIQIRGEVPRGFSDVYVTVAPDKDPSAIARAIARRVMPSYLAALDKANAQQKAEAEYKATIAANIARMVKAGASPRGNRADGTEFYAAGNRCSLSADRVSMELHGLTLAQAERIVRMLAKDD